MHTWLPDAHTEAPTAGSVILAGVMLKLGTYGFLRFAIPLFPEVAIEATPLFMALAVIGIVYGALVAMVQADLKRLVAYSSVSHLGFVMLGIFALDRQGIDGAVYQMLNHGVSTGGLFLLVGMMYLRRHTREISEFGGLWKVIPMYAAIFMVVMLSSIGLPGLNGFVGEFLILLGTYLNSNVATIFAVSGLILGALYMMWAYERVMWGPLTKVVNQTLRDLTPREISVMVPLIALMFFMGLYPRAAARSHRTFCRRSAQSCRRRTRPVSTRPIIAYAQSHLNFAALAAPDHLTTRKMNQFTLAAINFAWLPILPADRDGGGRHDDHAGRRPR